MLNGITKVYKEPQPEMVTNSVKQGYQSALFRRSFCACLNDLYLCSSLDSYARMKAALLSRPGATLLAVPSDLYRSPSVKHVRRNNRRCLAGRTLSTVRSAMKYI